MAKNILIVDDSAMMRKIITKNIKACGWDVNIVEASDGKEGFEVFMKGGLDLILSDWNMPNLDGLGMVKAIREKDPQKTIPIVMITTEGSADKVKEAVVAGANNYLAKPFTEEKFRDKLNAYLS